MTLEAENTDTPEVDTSAGDRMAAAVAKLEELDAAPEPAAPPAETPPLVEAATAVPPVEKVLEKPPEKPPEPVLDQETQEKLNLIGKREKETKLAHSARLAEIATQEKGLAEKLAKVESFEKLKARFTDDPVALLDHIDIKDPATKRALAEHLWYSTIGPDAPKEHKDKAEAAKLRAQIAQQQKALEDYKAEAARKEQEAQRQAVFANVRSELVTSLKGSAKAPLTKAYFEHNPDKTTNLLLDATVRLLEERVKNDPEGDVPGPDAIIEMFEKELEAEIAPLRAVLAPTPVAREAGEPVPAVRTLSSARTSSKSHTKSAALTEEERLARALAKLEGRA